MPSARSGRAATGATAAGGTLVEVSLQIPLAESERATALVAPFAPAGVAIELPFRQDLEFGEAELLPEGESRLCFYVPAADWPALRTRLRAALQRADWASRPRLRSRRLRAQDWATAWHAQVEVVRVGRLVVRPTPCRYDAKLGEVVVDIEPGVAFGTGQHETTRLALAAMERWLRPGRRVLDFGTGSGILACAAARLGAARVDAVDSDPLAVTAAVRNARLNQVQEAVQVWEGSRPGRARYDFVVANLTAGLLVELMPRLAAATRPGGMCVLGGIIAPHLRRVRAAVRATGLRPQETTADGDWRSIRATRPSHLS